MARHRLIFYTGDQPVGTFQDRGYPTQPGRIAYSPYRGPGHMQFAETLGRGEVARCWFARGNKRVAFDVLREDCVVGPPGSRSNWYIEVSRLGEAAANA